MSIMSFLQRKDLSPVLRNRFKVRDFEAKEKELTEYFSEGTWNEVIDEIRGCFSSILHSSISHQLRFDNSSVETYLSAVLVAARGRKCALHNIKQREDFDQIIFPVFKARGKIVPVPNTNNVIFVQEDNANFQQLVDSFGRVLSKEKDADYHRDLGKLLGYPESAIESFLSYYFPKTPYFVIGDKFLINLWIKKGEYHPSFSISPFMPSVSRNGAVPELSLLNHYLYIIDVALPKHFVDAILLAKLLDVVPSFYSIQSYHVSGNLNSLYSFFDAEEKG